MECSRLLALMALLPALAGCASSDGPQRAAEDDPIMAAALEGPLMVDPDLTQQNMRNQAVMPGGPIDPALPRFDDAPAKAAQTN